jgi:methylated-DNA-[protein]-cysteine S-methyltransferase
MLVTTMPTPTGPLTILASRDGAVRAAGFATGVEELLARVHPDLRGDPRPRADLGPVTAAVASYLDGDLTAIDAIPVEQKTSGRFLEHAWAVMRDIEPGEPIT